MGFQEQLPDFIRLVGGRCLTGVDSISKGLPEFVSIDEEPNDEIVHALRLGEAQRAADEARGPGPQMAVFALHVLGVLLAYLILLGMAMPLGGSPAVRVQLRDATRCRVVIPQCATPLVAPETASAALHPLT